MAQPYSFTAVKSTCTYWPARSLARPPRDHPLSTQHLFMVSQSELFHLAPSKLSTPAGLICHSRLIVRDRPGVRNKRQIAHEPYKEFARPALVY